MMDALEQARREIDTVDAQLAALFERRMKAVLSVAEYKKAHGLPIFDAAREKVVLDKAEARIGDPALRPYYRDHVQNMMDVAKQYEAEVLGRNRAAYQGVEGAFAHIALRALFPHAEAVSCPTWDEVFATRASGVGVSRRKFSRKGSTPKLVRAEPKNTGLSSPRSTLSRSNSSAAPSSSSISSTSCWCR